MKSKNVTQVKVLLQLMITTNLSLLDNTWFLLTRCNKYKKTLNTGD